jgi:hypothetical protein
LRPLRRSPVEDEIPLEHSDSESSDSDDEHGGEDPFDPTKNYTNRPRPSLGDETAGSEGYNEAQEIHQDSDNDLGDTIVVQLPEVPQRRVGDILEEGQPKLDRTNRRAEKAQAEKARKEAIRKETSARRLESRGESRRAGRALKACAILQDNPRDPKLLSYDEAMTGPDADDWRQAVDAEVEALRERGTFSGKIEKPPSGETVTAKLVFDTKVENGKVTRTRPDSWQEAFLRNTGSTMKRPLLRRCGSMRCGYYWR